MGTPEEKLGGSTDPSRNGPKPFGTCMMVSIPMPGQPEGMPVDIGRAMLNAATSTESDTVSGGRCRVEPFDGIAPFLRATLTTVGEAPNIPSPVELGAVIDGNGNDIARALTEQSNRVYSICSEVRDMLGLATVDIKKLNDTLRRDHFDRSNWMGITQGAPDVLARVVIQEDEKSMKIENYLARRVVPGFVTERHGGDVPTGEILYAYLEVSRAVQKVVRNILVYIYQREHHIVPAAEALLVQRDGTNVIAAASHVKDFLKVTDDIEGFRFNGKSGGDSQSLKFAPPYLNGNGRIPLTPPEASTPDEYYASHFTSRNPNAIHSYLQRVVLPILCRMQSAALTNPTVYNALYGNENPYSRQVDEILKLSEDELKYRANDVIRLFAAAFVFPINRSLESRRVVIPGGLSNASGASGNGTRRNGGNGGSGK